MTSETDINLIVSRYKTTGIMPDISIKQAAQYFDTTQVPSFQDAKNRIAQAASLFEQLPAELRFQMGNDPQKAENFFKDPQNVAILEKYGFVTTTPETPPQKPNLEAPVTPQAPPSPPSEA